jgi:hypothetical protein
MTWLARKINAWRFNRELNRNLAARRAARMGGCMAQPRALQYPRPRHH